MNLLQLIICNDTFLKSSIENPDILPESDKSFVKSGTIFEIESAELISLKHWKVQIINFASPVYVFKYDARIAK